MTRTDSVLAPKKLTIHDVARLAGTSKSTASRALQGTARIAPGTKAAVLEAARELGFEPNHHAQRLASGPSDTIGMFSPDLDLGVGTRKMQAIQQLLGARGYRVPIHAYGYSYTGDDVNHSDLLRDLCRQRPRAIVCNTNNLRQACSQAVLSQFCASGGIAVCYDWLEIQAADNVFFDRDHNTYLATRHLLELGHRDIGFSVHGYNGFDTDHPSPRWSGLKRALKEFGVSARPEWCFDIPFKMEFEEAGHELAQTFLALSKRPTAMCIVNDQAAIAFANEIGRAGIKVPDDLSIVGHDDAFTARCAPVPLTTVSHPIEQIAQSVIDLLETRLQGQYHGPPRKITVRGSLVQRQSTAPPRS